MTALRLIIFDVDGTLVDSQHHIAAAMRIAFESQGLKAPDLAATRGIIGLSLPQAMRALAPGADIDALVLGYKAAFVQQRHSTDPAPLFPGARAALETLQDRDDILLGIATGKSQRGLEKMIAAHNLAGFFVTRQVADHHPSKPHPSMIHACLSETGVEPHDAVMIGDTSFDMEMAAAAGVAGIGVNWGYHPAERLSAARRLIAGFNDLPDALAEIWEAAE